MEFLILRYLGTCLIGNKGGGEGETKGREYFFLGGGGVDLGLVGLGGSGGGLRFEVWMDGWMNG